MQWLADTRVAVQVVEGISDKMVRRTLQTIRSNRGGGKSGACPRSVPSSWGAGKTSSTGMLSPMTSGLLSSVLMQRAPQGCAKRARHCRSPLARRGGTTTSIAERELAICAGALSPPGLTSWGGHGSSHGSRLGCVYERSGGRPFSRNRRDPCGAGPSDSPSPGGALSPRSASDSLPHVAETGCSRYAQAWLLAEDGGQRVDHTTGHRTSMAWEQDRKAAPVTINWPFTTAKAPRKLNRWYPL